MRRTRARIRRALNRGIISLGPNEDCTDMPAEIPEAEPQADFAIDAETRAAWRDTLLALDLHRQVDDLLTRRGRQLAQLINDRPFEYTLSRCRDMARALTNEEAKMAAHIENQGRFFGSRSSRTVIIRNRLQMYRDIVNAIIGARLHFAEISDDAIWRIGYYNTLRLHLSKLVDEEFSAKETMGVARALRIARRRTVMHQYLENNQVVDDEILEIKGPQDDEV